MPRATPPPPPSQARTRGAYPRFRTPFASQQSSSQSPSSQVGSSQAVPSQAAPSAAVASQAAPSRPDRFQVAASQIREGRLHPWFSDPAARIVFVSCEGIQFRPSNHPLSLESDHFRQMLEGLGDGQKETIHLDYHSTTVAVFLGVIFSGSDPSAYDLGYDYHEIDKVIELLTEYRCLNILPHVKAQFREAIRKNGYIAFQWASHRNDVDLGREALRGCTNSWTYSKSSAALKEYVRGIAKIWVAGFYDVVVGDVVEPGPRGRTQTGILLDWSRVADRFDPKF